MFDSFRTGNYYGGVHILFVHGLLSTIRETLLGNHKEVSPSYRTHSDIFNMFNHTMRIRLRTVYFQQN